MSQRKIKTLSPSRNRTDSEDPKDLDRRIFVANLPTYSITREEMEDLFSKYGKISGLTMFRRIAFVQYERKEDADAAVEGENGRKFKGNRLEIRGARMNRTDSNDPKALDKRRMNRTDRNDPKELDKRRMNRTDSNDPKELDKRRMNRTFSPSRNRTDSDDPKELDKRIFVAKLPTDRMSREDMENLFSVYGKISGLTMFRRFGFVQYERKEDADAAVAGENGRMYKGNRLEINKAAERRNMFKTPSRASPPRRDLYGYGESQEPRRDRSPLRSSPRRDREPRERDSRSLRDSRHGREPRDTREPKDLRDSLDRNFRDGPSSRDVRDLRDARDPRDYRDPRDAKDLRDARDVRDPRDAREVKDPLYDRYKDVRDTHNPYSADVYDDYRKRQEYLDRYKEPLDRNPDDRHKREERRREELYRQNFDELQRKMDQDRGVDCSVVTSKQSKDYAESVGRKIRDLGMLVDLIFLNTEVSSTQVLEDVSRAGTPFAIMITQQHQTHRSCTVNILFGTPQEHRNMPLVDAMVLVARCFDRYKVEKRDKEREDIGRQAAKLSTDAILRERAAAWDEGTRALPPPGIMTLLNLLADNRYITSEEIDKVILYLRDRKERILALSGDPLKSQLSRPLGVSSGPSLEGSSTLLSSQTMPLTQQLTSGDPATQTPSTSQQELQAKILSLFNSGGTSSKLSANPTSLGATTAPGQSYGNVASTQRATAPGQSYGNVASTQRAPTPGQSYGNVASTQRASTQMDIPSLVPSAQRSQPIVNQHPSSMTQGEGIRSAASRPATSTQMQSMYGQLRPQAPSNVPNQRPGVSSGINFDNPSVQKALDSLIQSGPALSHLMSQTAAQTVRTGPLQQPSVVSYPRHY